MTAASTPASLAAHLAVQLADLHTAAETIWQSGVKLCPGLSVDVLPTVESTNTALMQRARTGDVAPCLLTAAAQTAGRGRHGRQWASQTGQSLTFSLGLPMKLDQIPGGGSALSLAVGLALAQSIDAAFAQLDYPAPKTWLKWPNDLWWQQRKLGGILIEATPSPALPADQRWVVIGVGLNIGPVNGAPLASPLSESAAQPVPPHWLQSHWPAHATPLTPGQVWAWVAPDLIRAVLRFEQQGFAPWMAAYQDRDALLGQEVALWHAAGAAASGAAPTQTGTAQGVDGQGALIVHTQGQQQTWTSGDVTVRLRPPHP